MAERRPQIVVLGGPNGAGKTTAANGVLRDLFHLGEFVNADTIAAGLSGIAPERSAFAAGRIMLSRLRDLARERADFAFETRMASRTFVPWLRDLKSAGYQLNLVFLWIRSPELAIRRIRRRVKQGGHHVPSDGVRRRYHRGVVNFMYAYAALASVWRVYDNSSTVRPLLVARGGEIEPIVVYRRPIWDQLQKEVSRGAEG